VETDKQASDGEIISSVMRHFHNRICEGYKPRAEMGAEKSGASSNQYTRFKVQF
jgi:hypothetical protein